jgi:hypothetical protein
MSFDQKLDKIENWSNLTQSNDLGTAYSKV